jgi:hypothetical protein
LNARDLALFPCHGVGKTTQRVVRIRKTAV